MTDAVIEITASSTKLCCAASNCMVKSSGKYPNLVVSGSSVIIQDVIFLDGVSTVQGGNVGIFGSGNHRIINSSFRNGASTTRGGNLYVSTNGTVTIENSSFLDGTADLGGGGLAVEAASAVTVMNSDFMGNMGPEGGGFYSTKKSPSGAGQMITIMDSSFIGNSAEVGGGFLVTQLGTMPTLSILSTEFTDNTASVAGTGAIVEFLDNLMLILKDNTGTGNVADQLCDGFLGVYSNSTEPVCIPTTENFPK
jgi:hypothetical protein